MAQTQNGQQEQLTHAVVKFNSILMGTILGLLFGIGLFLATVLLVLKGGPNPGPHLSLLGQYFPWYTVSWGGSILGLLYGFVTGFIAGAILGAVYNKVAR